MCFPDNCALSELARSIPAIVVGMWAIAGENTACLLVPDYVFGHLNGRSEAVAICCHDTRCRGTDAVLSRER